MNIIRTSLLFFTFLFFNCFLFGQFDKDNDGGDSTRANSPDEFECRKNHHQFSLGSQQFLETIMVPRITTLGVSSPIINAAGFEADIAFNGSPQEPIIWDLGIIDSDLPCVPDANPITPLGPYRIEFAVRGEYDIVLLNENEIMPNEFGTAIESFNLTAFELNTLKAKLVIVPADDLIFGNIEASINYTDLETQESCSIVNCDPSDPRSLINLKVSKNFNECPTDFTADYVAGIPNNTIFTYTLEASNTNNLAGNYHIREQFCDIVPNFSMSDLEPEYVAQLPIELQNNEELLIEFLLGNASGGSFLINAQIGQPLTLQDTYRFGPNFLQFKQEAIQNNSSLGYTAKQKFICGDCEGIVEIFSHTATVNFIPTPVTVTFSN